MRHVLSAEGEGWFHPEKLTSVVDTFVNSRLNMSVQRDKSDFAKRPVPKSFGAGTGLQETGGVNKSFYTPGPTKSNTFVGENKLPRCTNCHKFGHFAKNCWFEKGVTSTPRSLDKNTKQTAQTAAPKSNSTGQPKVNHVSVQSDLPAYLHHACLADKIPTKLHFPSQKAHEEVNNVLRGMGFLDTITVQGNDVEGQDGMTSTSANFVSTLTGYDDFDSTTAASETQLPLKGGVTTVGESAVPCSGVKLIEISDTGKPAVCFSELEYLRYFD